MSAYITKRLGGVIPVLIGVSIIVFAIMHLLPGDVARMILMGSSDTEALVSAEAIETLRDQLGLNKPLPIQYFDWIGGLLRLDAGKSLWSGQPVLQELGQRLPLSAELALLSLVISLLIALPVGILSALRQDTWVDYLFRVVSIGGLALPSFWLGTLLVLFLTVGFDWMPPLGYVHFKDDPLTNLQQLIWPALVLGYNNAAIVSRMTRSTMLEVLRQDYMRTALAKGLDTRSLMLRHALRNAFLPVLTIIAVQTGHLLGGTVLMETIFTLPGIGRYLVDAISHRDFPVVQAIIVGMAVLFVFLNLLVDILYAVLDPRIRYQ